MFYGSALVMLIIMALVFANIIGRSVFNWPIPGAIELVGLLMIMHVFFPLAKTQETKRHIAVTFVVDRLPIKLKWRAQFIVLVLSFAIFVILAWRLGIEARQSIAAREFIAGSIDLPWYPSRIVAALGSLFMCCELVLELIEHLRFKPK